jgi:polyhydroxyalkanoate synthesis repressor PhaR
MLRNIDAAAAQQRTLLRVRMTTPTNEPVTIKKYANRRLYNTATSSYVTLDHLADMVKRGQEFNVYDAKSGEDITRSVLTQIIFEEEGKGGQQLLPIQFLRQLIRFYGDSMQALVPGYLNLSMDSFSRNHERIREQVQSTFGGKGMLKEFESIARQNMQMFERAMRMFTPFGALMKGREEGAAGTNGAEGAMAEPQERDEEIADLKAQLEIMRRQLDDIANRKQS